MTTHDDRVTAGAITRQVTHLAKILDGNLAQAIRVAPLYAALGWPTGTLGDGTGSRGADDTTSTERAALELVEGRHPFAGSDRRLTGLLLVLRYVSDEVAALVTTLVEHADDVDEIPPGTGECEACGHFCNPKKNPNDRIRGGLCDACYRHWLRHGQGDRHTWLRARRVMTGRTEGATGLAARFAAAYDGQINDPATQRSA